MFGDWNKANKSSKQAEVRHGILISVFQIIWGKDQFFKKNQAIMD